MGCGSSKDTSGKSIQLIKKNSKQYKERLAKAEQKYETFKTVDDYIGIQHQLPIQKLLALGFKIVFSETYRQETSLEDLLMIRAQCQQDTIVCVAGINKIFHTDLLQVACIDKAMSVFNLTKNDKKAKKSENNNYFYMMDKFSFGFSPEENIFLDCADQQDHDSKNRLSWLLNGVGGGRLGQDWCAFENGQDFHKVIMIL